MNTSEIKGDLVVLGGGPGGYPAAISAAQRGLAVVLVEQEALGGTCLNWGCIPTKTLLASAEFYANLSRASSLGVNIGAAAIDYEAMACRKDEIVTKLHGGITQLLAAHGVTVLHGKAAFLGPNRVGVTGADGTVCVEAGHVIVATGSEPVMPSHVPGDPRILDSRDFLARRELPNALLVMGGGVIGCEFACMAAQLGVRVTLVELLDDILLMLDKDVRRVLRRHMEQTLGIRIMTGHPLQDIQTDGREITGRVGPDHVEADLMLCAVGRRPRVAGLALKAAGLVEAETGGLSVDAAGRTAVPGIWAVGDVVAGSTQLAHAATAQGMAVAESVASGQARDFETVIPACIFTAPEIGVVGLTEEKARAEGRTTVTGKYGFAALGKALAIGHPEGFVKWVACPETDRLLGAQAVGPHATDLIAEAVVAIRHGLTAVEFGRTVHAHPTLSEAWMEAAHALHGVCIHQPPRRRRSQQG